MCTGADFGCGRVEEDLDRAARGEAEEAVEATTIIQCALIGHGRRRTSPRDANDTERVWLWRAGRSPNEEAACELSETTLDGPNPNKAPRGKATEGTESCAEAHLGQATSGSWQVQRCGEQCSSAS